MQPTNSHEQYREVQVNTADRGKLLMMLFDGCLNFLTLTKEGFEQNDAQKSSKYMGKSQAIIAELMNTLDFKQSEELARNLAGLYEFMLFYLTEANFEKDPVKVEKVIELLGNIASGYREVIEGGKLSSSDTPLTGQGTDGRHIVDTNL